MISISIHVVNFLITELELCLVAIPVSRTVQGRLSWKEESYPPGGAVGIQTDQPGTHCQNKYYCHLQ